jgi:hypothetical protein
MASSIHSLMAFSKLRVRSETTTGNQLFSIEKKEFLLMATVSDVPDLSRNMMTIGARHLFSP